MINYLWFFLLIFRGCRFQDFKKIIEEKLKMEKSYHFDIISPAICSWLYWRVLSFCFSAQMSLSSCHPFKPSDTWCRCPFCRGPQHLTCFLCTWPCPLGHLGTVADTGDLGDQSPLCLRSPPGQAGVLTLSHPHSPFLGSGAPPLFLTFYLPPFLTHALLFTSYTLTQTFGW